MGQELVFQGWGGSRKGIWEQILLLRHRDLRWLTALAAGKAKARHPSQPCPWPTAHLPSSRIA